MKKDITEEITKAAEVPKKLKELSKLMKYKEKELYVKNKRKKGRK